MTQPQSVDSFFSGGGKSVKFPTIGTSVTGTIAAVHSPEQQTTPQGDPVVDKKTGAPKMQVRIELITDERDPSDENDDGRRTLWVKGWLKGAIGDALRRAGVSGSPAIGGKLTVTFTEEEPNVGLSPTKKYSATYVPPSATGDFFGGGQPSQAAAPPAAPAAEPLPPKPAAISQEAWNQMPDATKRQVAQTMSATTASDQPPW